MDDETRAAFDRLERRLDEMHAETTAELAEVRSQLGAVVRLLADLVGTWDALRRR
jgi:hypothetical protein